VDECYEHTDLKWRLTQIPDNACCRGLYLNSLDASAYELGPEVLEAYRQFFQTYRFSAFRLYPVKDYLTRLVKLAQLKYGGPGIYRGIFDIHAKSPEAFRRTVLGRVTFDVLGMSFHTMVSLLKRGVSNSVNYMEFNAIREAHNQYLIRFKNEYVYIEHAMAGALQGLANISGVSIQQEIMLADPFNGDIRILVTERDQRTVAAP
jgi:uncharacterized protein (TIGR02265 family)